MGILIICLKNEENRVKLALTREASLNWEKEGVVSVQIIPPLHKNNKEFIRGRIKGNLPVDGSLLHIITIGIALADFEFNDRISVMATAGVKSFERRALPKLLKDLGQDWLSKLDQKFRNSWHHGRMDRDYLERWIRQFDECDGHRWVGERLLRVLEFWSDMRLREALNITQDGLKGFDCVAVNRHKRAGKSADAIASLVQKQLDFVGIGGVHPDVQDFREAIETDEINKILFVEDCLITGNEMIRVLTALMGREDTFGSAKADPLTNPDLLRQKEITLRFAVVTNGGVLYVEQFLRNEGLSKIKIEGADVLQTLTADGLALIESNNLYDSDDCIVEPDSHVIRPCFKPVELWGGDEKAGRALKFCADIGRQLYKLYLDKRSKSMSDKRVDESALGIRGLALALAFSHSVPKETLPLFWTGGEIKYKAKKLNWIPLFEGGE